MSEINLQKSDPLVIAYIASEQNAESALRALHSAGFTGNQIRVAYNEEPAISVKKPEPGFWHRTQALFGGGANPNAVRTGSVQPLSTGQAAGAESTGRYDLDAGDFRRTLTGLKLPEYRSRHFSERFERGKEGALVIVEAGSRTEDAERILLSAGGDLGETEGERSSKAERLRRAS
jgi:hypothetical protein